MSIHVCTCESVTEGHPDKVCDQIADAVLDEVLRQDPYGRCACEVTAEAGAVHIMGEISTTAHVDVEACAREVIRKIGYTRPELGFDDRCAVSVSLHEQSGDIAMGVDHAADCNMIGAGDQGMMFGYACLDSDDYMPLPLVLAHGLTSRLSALRKSGQLPYLRPDGKAQVSVKYVDERPVRVTNITLSAQHDPQIHIDTLRRDLEEQVIRAVIPAQMMDDDTVIYINPTGRFVHGGPAADCGLSGRKIIVDTYGGCAHHGGGAFSGKDPTKVDRSAAYMARYIAKNIVAAGLAERCEIQLSYAIGVAEPTSVSIDTFNSGRMGEDRLCLMVKRLFDLTPQGIIDTLKLRRPIYLPTAAYGHFSAKQTPLPWECLDQVPVLRKAFLRFLQEC